MPNLVSVAFIITKICVFIQADGQTSLQLLALNNREYYMVCIIHYIITEICVFIQTDGHHYNCWS